MEWMRVVGLVVAAVVLLSILKQYNPVYAVVGSVACCAIMLGYAALQAAPVVGYLADLAETVSGADFTSVVRAMGIALAAQTARDVCKDAGQTALAGQVELAGRVLILLAALPLFQQLLQLVAGLLA